MKQNKKLCNVLRWVKIEQFHIGKVNWKMSVQFYFDHVKLRQGGLNYNWTIVDKKIKTEFKTQLHNHMEENHHQQGYFCRVYILFFLSFYWKTTTPSFTQFRLYSIQVNSFPIFRKLTDILIITKLIIPNTKGRRFLQFSYTSFPVSHSSKHIIHIKW